MHVLLYEKKNRGSSLAETIIAIKIHIRLFLHIYNKCEGKRNVLEMEGANVGFPAENK